MDYKLAYGVKLFQTTCKMCPNTFFVPKSCPQEYCSEWCKNKDKHHMKFGNPGKRKKKVSYSLSEEDLDE